MSPRPGPPKPTITIRLSEAGIANLDELAAREGVDRSEVMRRMLNYAARYMPQGWEPVKAVSAEVGYLGGAVRISTMCVCGQNQTVVAAPAGNVFIAHLDKAGDPCPGLPLPFPPTAQEADRG